MARATQAEFQRVRWRAYLEGAFAGGAASRAAVADALDVPTSRVSQWLAGERGVEAATAFAAGETLRAQFGVTTSGTEALYAAAYFGDVLRVLRAVALDERPGARDLAIALYASLPARFLATDLRALDAYDGSVDGYRENEFETREAARLRRDGELARVPASPESLAARAHCAQIATRPNAFEIVAGAWAAAQRPLELPRVVMPRAMPQMPSAPAGMPAPVAAAAAYEAYPEASVPAPLEPAAPQAVAALIDVVIALARALEARNPTLTAPRLWRMLAEWAIELDAQAYMRCVGALPSAYVPVTAEAL